MDTKKAQSLQKNRFQKLSLKKKTLKINDEPKQLNRSSDVILIDESFEKLRSDFGRTIHSSQKVYSPIVINDSSEISLDDEDLPNIELPQRVPSQNGNVSFNCSREESPKKRSYASFGGWSPAQNIICATPRYEPIPSTPKDVANESIEQCSIKRIEQSQKKILNDLYGNTWMSIPKLFKTLTHQCSNFNGVSKKLQFEDEESDKENIRHELKRNKELYLTCSDIKNKTNNFGDTEKKSKKKLYTEKVPSTPEVPRIKPVKTREVNTTVKKVKVTKGMSVTELVEVMKKDVDLITKKVGSVAVSPPVEVKRLSFVGSLSDNIPSWRCHVEAIQYKDSYKTLREDLTRRLYVEFNKGVFENKLDDDMLITWDSKLRSTAGTTRNCRIKNAAGHRIRTSSIKLSTKVLDSPQRLRDTLIHELCHAATWLIDNELKAGHGSLWKKWATRSLRVYPELGEISRCHNLDIHYKYCYRCTRCGYSIKRHSKSIDVTNKCCGHCRGDFELTVNKKNKDGVVISTPARKAGPNAFALYVKDNYATIKDGGKTHAQVMKILGEQFSAMKSKT